MRLIAAPPPIVHGSPPPSTGSSSGSSAIRTLQMMGVKPARARGRFILNSHVANLIHVARDVTGVRWPEIAYTAGLAQYVDQDPPNDEQLATPVEYLGRLNEAFETIYGPEAEDQLRAWGRRATERWLAEGRHGMGGPRRLVPGRQRKLAGIVRSFSEAMDNVRGEHTHAWLQVDEFQFWLVNFSNMFALGRIKTVKSCHRHDRGDPALGRAGQRLVRGRGGVRVRDRDLRLCVRDPLGRNLINETNAEWGLRPDLFRPSPRHATFQAPASVAEERGVP